VSVRRVMVAVVAGVGAASLALGGAAAAAVPRTLGNGDVVAPFIAAGTPLPAAITSLESALMTRMTALVTLQSDVAGSKSLTTADRTALDTVLATATTGITTLLSKVPADAKLAAVRADAAAMVLDYHVLSLVTPQVTVVIAADHDLARLSALDAQAPAIAAAIAAASQAHESVLRERTLQASFLSHLHTLSVLVSGLPASMLALGPSSIPGSLATLAAASRATVRAGTAADAASAAEQRIVTLLARPGSKVSGLAHLGA